MLSDCQREVCKKKVWFKAKIGLKCQAKLFLKKNQGRRKKEEREIGKGLC